MSLPVSPGLLSYTLLGTSASDDLQITLVLPDSSSIVIPKNALQQQVDVAFYPSGGIISVSLQNLTQGTNFPDTDTANCRVTSTPHGWQLSFEDTIGGDYDFNDMVILVEVNIHADWTVGSLGMGVN